MIKFRRQRNDGDSRDNPTLRPRSRPDYGLRAMVARGGIHYDLVATDRYQAIERALERIPLTDPAARGQLLARFWERETLRSTAVGNGVAIPHPRQPLGALVVYPKVSLCFLREPVCFGSPDGKPVRALFAVICPTIRTHLQTVSQLVTALADPPFARLIDEQASIPALVREMDRLAKAEPTSPLSSLALGTAFGAGAVSLTP